MSSLKKTTTTEYIQLQLILTNLSLMRSKLQNNGKNNANGLILNGGLFDSIYSLDFINKCKVYTSIPFTSNLHTSRIFRTSLKSSRFIRLAPL